MVALFISLIIGVYIYTNLESDDLLKQLKSYVLWFICSLVLLAVNILQVYNSDFSQPASYYVFIVTIIGLLALLKTSNDAWLEFIKCYKVQNADNIAEMYRILYEMYSADTYIKKILPEYRNIRIAVAINVEMKNYIWFFKLGVLMVGSISFAVLYFTNIYMVKNVVDRINYFFEADIKNLWFNLFGGNKELAGFVFVTLFLVGIITWHIVQIVKKTEGIFFVYFYRILFCTYLLVVMIISKFFLHYINAYFISTFLWIATTVVVTVYEKKACNK